MPIILSGEVFVSLPLINIDQLQNSQNMQNLDFQLVVDGAPYTVKATPYDFNGEKRFTITYNSSEEYVFVYDTQLSSYAVIGDNALDLPDNLETAIAEKINKYAS